MILYSGISEHTNGNSGPFWHIMGIYNLRFYFVHLLRYPCFLYITIVERIAARRCWASA
jgi:hypothetical protein